MSRPRIQTALIVDSTNSRASQIEDALLSVAVTTVRQRDAIVYPSQGCSVRNLWAAAEGLPPSDMLFIHLGPPDEDRKRKTYGNKCSMEFFLHHLAALHRRCVIAYTGGDPPEPEQFAQKCDPQWHRFFPNVMGASALQIVPFVQIWRHDPDSAPPLDVLTAPCPQVSGFTSLCLLYRAAHKKNLPAEMARMKRPDTWRHLFAGERAQDNLLLRLQWLRQMRLSTAACLVKEWLDSDSPEASFDEELHQALLATGTVPDDRAALL